jgi:ElaB/YqjD/DUF883 family membrane-anchored ribosome-binding protein
MTTPRWTVATLLAAALVVAAGCDDSSKPTEPKVNTNPTLPTADQLKADAAKAVDQGKAAVGSAAEKVKEATPAVVDKAKETTANAVDATKNAAANAGDALKGAAAKAPDAAKNAAAHATDATATARAQGTELLAKLRTAIQENKLTDAQTYVDGLERIKANLPPELKTQYEGLKASFDAMKAKAAGAVPQLNK